MIKMKKKWITGGIEYLDEIEKVDIGVVEDFLYLNKIQRKRNRKVSFSRVKKNCKECRLKITGNPES